MTCDGDQRATVRAELRVNGQTIELNEFVQGFMGLAVMGMVMSLRGVNEVETLRFDVSRSPE